MKTLLKTEELAQLILSIVLFSYLPYAWWVYPALLLVPDISMLGYLINPKAGAIGYNLGHHKGLAVAIGVAGFLFASPLLMLTGLILFGHASMDRVMGYGFKYADSFRHTHLGTVGTQHS
ncbi:DUF4260 domain-containing protein [Arsenicibacter rosenii]|uniref:DUF4260 domain-containing protein n=1 Tax=Arsenicibacter rosenii TaxID=1750698 RepID=A0A1S2VRQ5_9BACT|nr:DUF4260 domain-containing protein [Arsenicibacter rosenii]OIN60995.1 hypothetical protein BLX24_02645 [Arsenicibacter rosenii]